MNTIISKIRNQFLNEARNSPLLFNDLANVEKYISESYSGRSLIELLQNADDALAKRFYVKIINDSTYIVANDGRSFDEKDILALCRSGASTKTRHSNTIGFRGIGFKSVVNYAEVVHLSSGNIKTTFSRILTKKLISGISDVPLIRIPHEFGGQKYSNLIDDLLKDGYTSVFNLETKNDMLSKEIEEFDSNCILFLKSIKEVCLCLNDIKTYEICRKNFSEQFYNTQIRSTGYTSNWLVAIPREKESKCSVAFNFDGQKVLETSIKDAVVHSFMPTYSRMSMRMKINGDFSTDPSRTRIVIDSETYKASQECTKLISSLIIDILENKNDKYGLLEIIKKAKIDPLSQVKGIDVNDIIVMDLKESIVQYINNNISKGNEIFLQPQGISDEDFERIVKYLHVYGIGNRDNEKLPGLFSCLKAFGVEEMPMDKCLFAMRELECSENTRATVLVNAINKTMLATNEQLKNDIKNAKLITFNSGVKPIAEIKEDEVVDTTFEGVVSERLTSIADYRAFCRKIGMNENQIAMEKNSTAGNDIGCSNFSGYTKAKKSVFSKKKTIKRWRSVEKNVAAVLELLDEVNYVVDVSKQNLGYDLEAVLKDGKRQYYEVKCVNGLGDMISITNNEYSTATQYKNDYYLAIASQTDTNIDVCFIKNPINSLSLSKRITRWEWICDEYEGEVISTNMSN